MSNIGVRNILAGVATLSGMYTVIDAIAIAQGATDKNLMFGAAAGTICLVSTGACLVLRAAARKPKNKVYSPQI